MLNLELEASWPDDADGDVLRRMHEHGFDFSASVPIDFNVDLEDWPPSHELVAELNKRFGSIKIHEPDEYRSYISFVIIDRVSYELVMSIQRSVSEFAAQYGAVCESWGVLQD